MSDFSSLIASVQSYIRQNGNNEITGSILQEVLVGITNTLGTQSINALETGLSTEQTTRANADTALGGRIDTEVGTRQQADTALGGRIDGLVGTIGDVSGIVTSLQTRLDEGFLYKGIATPSTNPSTPTGKVFYVAVQAGTYTNFGGLTVSQGINIIKYNGATWSVDVVIGIDEHPTGGSMAIAGSGGTYEDIQDAKFNAQESTGLTMNFTLHQGQDNAGNTKTLVNWGTTDYIPIKKGDVLTLKTGTIGSTTNRNLCVFDENKDFVTSYYWGYTTEWSVTVNVDGYVKVSFGFLDVNLSDIYVKNNDFYIFKPQAKSMSLFRSTDFAVLQPIQLRSGNIQVSDGSVVSTTGTGSIIGLFDIHELVGKRIFVTKLYMFQANNVCGVAYYSEDMTYIGCEFVGADSKYEYIYDQELVIPDNAYYLRVKTTSPIQSSCNVYTGGALLINKDIDNKTKEISLTARGLRLVSTDIIKGFVKGHKYRITLAVPPLIDEIQVETPSVYIQFGVKAVTNHDTGIDIINKTLTDYNPKGIYDFTFPSDGDYIGIMIYYRANNEQEQTFNIEDITDIDSYLNGNFCVSQFNRIAVIGDSWSSGFYKTKPSESFKQDIRKYSWIANLARKNGVLWHNFAVRGATVASWLGKEEGYFDASTQGVDAMLAAPPCDLYVVWWGSNERGNEDYPIGSMADINDEDYTQNANTFYGNTARCVQEIMAHAPLSKIIFICPSTPSSYTGDTVDDGDLIQPRLDIIEHFGLATLDMNDDSWYNTAINLNRSALPGSHPSFVDMAGMALAFERLLPACVNRYREYFNDFYNSEDFKIGDNTNPNTNEE